MEIEVSQIYNNLLGIYPNKVYLSINEMKKYPVYKELYAHAQHNNVAISDVLKEFKFEKYSKYDTKRMMEISNQYDFIQSDFSDFFDISRQLVSQKVKNNMNHNFFWEEKVFSDSEKKTIYEEIIEKKKWTYESLDKNKKHRIITNFKKVLNKADVNLILLTILKKEEKIYINHLNNSLFHDSLKKHRYYDFSEEAYKKTQQILSNIYDCLNEDNIISVKVKKEIDSILKESIITDRKIFFEYLGLDSSLDYQDRRYADEKRFNKLLQKYSNDKNEVEIPSNSKDYAYLANNASRADMSLKKFIESKGFVYVTVRNTFVQQEKIRGRLKKRSFGKNLVYINPIDPLYNSLSTSALRQDMNLSTLLKEKYGYKRMLLKDISKNIKLYDWTKELDLKNEEEVKDYIISFLDEENTLQISSNSSLYRQLYIFSKSIKSEPTEVLKKWGLRYNFTPSEIDKGEQIADLLEELEHLNSQISKLKTVSEKLSRSKELVAKLKTFYNYQCQICSQKNQIPPILTEEGHNYVEVHHIRPLHEFNMEKSVNDESNKLIDHYKNCLVVCPHHHKYIHYYKGGFKKKVQNNHGTYLVTDEGENLLINLNYHI